MRDKVLFSSLIESLENSPHRKKCSFELALSALFWGTSKVSFGTIEVD
jgi:hypothetical protein